MMPYVKEHFELKKEETNMQKRKNLSEDAVFITVDTASRLTNLGRNTVRKLAQEGNAARKIGKSFRINKKIFLDYVDSFES